MAIEIGAVVEGEVTGITNFGAFLQLPKAKVLSIDARGKIALSLKQLEEKPETPAKPVRPKEAPVVEKRAPRQTSPLSFEDKLSNFMKDSDDRLLDLRRNTESKRGGRGASRDR